MEYSVNVAHKKNFELTNSGSLSPKKYYPGSGGFILKQRPKGALIRFLFVDYHKNALAVAQTITPFCQEL